MARSIAREAREAREAGGSRKAGEIDPKCDFGSAFVTPPPVESPL